MSARPYNLPLLPGYSVSAPSTKTHHGRKSSFQFNGTNPVVAAAPGRKEANPKLAQVRAADGTMQPKWKAFDRQTLCFHAYFQEAVHELKDEQYRVRLCRIYYFPEDDTIKVTEKAVQNSGIAQGVLIQRQQIPRKGTKLEGDHVTVDCFNVGKEITLFARTFKIFDCDKFTRNFLTKLGVRVGESSQPPSDPHTARRQAEKDSQSALRPYEKIDKMEKFLKHDRQVLRFYALWDDTDNMFGDRRYMVLHFFLADDTVEICEVQKPNSGRTPGVFLKKQKLPKDASQIVRQPGAQTDRTVLNVLGGTFSGSRSMTDSLRMGAPDSPYYTDADLSIGANIEVYGRRFVICDCDEFTRTYYREKYGIEDMSPINVDEDEPEIPMPEPPPYTGFGSERDSLASVLNLRPKVPRKQAGAYAQRGPGLENSAFRFTARLNSSSPLDADRRFVVTFYLADDSIAIFESKVNNSGFKGGKFLERRPVKHPDGNGNYLPTDLYIGAEIDVLRHKFVLTDADEYSLTFMEQNRFPMSDASKILDDLADLGAGKREELVAAFQAADDGAGYVSAKGFQDAIRSTFPDAKLNHHELRTLLRRFGLSESHRETELHEIVSQLRGALARSNYDRFPSIREAFLFYDRDRNGFLSRERVKSICEQFNIPISEDLMDALMEAMPSHPEGIAYRDFVDFLDYRSVQDVPKMAGSVSAGDTLNKTLMSAMTQRAAADVSEVPYEEFVRALYGGDGDGDGDGGNPQVQAARRLYARLFDHNQDGRVSFDEFMDTVLGQNPDLGEDRAAALFDAVDADADQIISEEEFVDHWLATL
eukprot:m.376819 g.376819  ORF g.376819 m.376819 type:complete len:817 (-) comp20017_c10_seq12:104-2554(-)